MENNKRRANDLWIKILITISIFCQLIVTVWSICIPEELEVYDYLSQYGISKKLTSIFFEIITSYFDSMPIITFVFFYIIVCNNIRNIIKFIGESRSEKGTIMFERFIASFSAIKTVVDEIDKEVGFLVFAIIAFSSSFTCVSFYIMIDSEIWKTQTFSIFGILFNSFGLLIAMTVSASMVEENSLEVLRSSTAVLNAKNRNLSITQYLSYIDAQNGITLTVWRIVPIRRSFIFGMIGVLFTYTTMIYSLSPISSKP
ncbi:hypothetical protein CDAR_580011 [Caerostris darwini]|uniref:Gustatory receptor n=1 Tax=Caerostris darwini TaxID=1538125 RepID=A0AAV4RFB4_9ARAC|nr:hypothetical protein CDAR_580011 [Caerostris darwini]